MPDDLDEEAGKAALLRRRLMVSVAAAASDTEAAKNLAEEVRALERALAAAAWEREVTEARRREAEKRAEEAADELRAAVEENGVHVEELLRRAAEKDAKDARIRELEGRIQAVNNMTSKWRWF